MALLSDYTAGTVTVAANGTTVTGVGTAWQVAEYGAFKDGDLFIANGYFNLVESVQSNTELTLTMPWRGGALSGAEYRLRYMSDGSRASAQARALIDMLGGSGSLEALAALSGAPNMVPYFTGPGTMGLIAMTELVNGVRSDVQVDTLADRDLYDAQPEGFVVLVANNGDGRAAVYTRQGAAGNWSDPAFITGPAITLAVTEVDEVPYGVPPDVTLTPIAGGYDMAFEIPRGMIIEPGTTTTLAPGAQATVDFVPVTGGYRLDIGLPKGDTGDIDGVTPFWVTRLSNDTNAAAARTGLGATTVGSDLFTATNAAAARTTLALQNVANLAPPDLPISTATQTALNGKANLAGGNTFTGGQTIHAYQALTTRSTADGWQEAIRFLGTDGRPTWTFNYNSFVTEQLNIDFYNWSGWVRTLLTLWPSGAVNIPGTLSKGSGTFLIDHPLDPENRDLAHGFVESNEYLNLYRGVVRLVDGVATVDLNAECGMSPGTTQALNADFICQSLQNQDSFVALRPDGPIIDGVLKIVASDPDCNDLVSWFVTARRNDPFVRSDLDHNTDSEGRFIPERDKPEAE